MKLIIFYRYLILMRIGILFFLILNLISCAKPADPSKSRNPIYASIMAFVSGVETNCPSCLMMEVVGNAVGVEFTDNGVEECSGEGRLSYLFNRNIVFPDNLGVVEQFQGSVVGNNSDKNPFCFPDLLDISIEKKSTNFFELNYNGKIFKIQKIN